MGELTITCNGIRAVVRLHKDTRDYNITKQNIVYSCKKTIFMQWCLIDGHKQFLGIMTDQLKLKYNSGNLSTIFVDSVILEVCATEAFKRLKDISFLGAVEKCPSMIRHNRFDHSIGVARLAQYYALKMNFSEDERRKVVLAALLHDIGHAPLSHSLEPLFSKEFGLNHHIASENLLKGKVKLGASLYKVLSRHNVDPGELIHLTSGGDSSEQGRIFSSPINVDTIEAVWRGGSYLRKQFFNPLKVLDAFITLSDMDKNVLDSFWEAKNSFYKLIIYSKSGVAADHWARERIENSSVELHPKEFYYTERSFFASRANEKYNMSSCTINIGMREFSVNETEKIKSYECLFKRFTVNRTNKEVMLEAPECEPPAYYQSTIF